VCIKNYDFLELDEIHLSYDYLDYIYELYKFAPNNNTIFFELNVVKLIYCKLS
jgi:hypothetical protein